jgi:hypothetical protein
LTVATAAGATLLVARQLATNLLRGEKEVDKRFALRVVIALNVSPILTLQEEAVPHAAGIDPTAPSDETMPASLSEIA